MNTRIENEPTDLFGFAQSVSATLYYTTIQCVVVSDGGKIPRVLYRNYIYASIAGSPESDSPVTDRCCSLHTQHVDGTS
jgi:hypothetical protein